MIGGKWEAFPVPGFDQLEFNFTAVYAGRPDDRRDITYLDSPCVVMCDHGGDFSHAY
ncbi:MAG: hypothetical protein U0M72_00480 [Eggerthellaceae bacterium]